LTVSGNGKLKVLFICHNHPSLYPGGAEKYALEIYEEMRDSGLAEPILLARAGMTAETGAVAHPGTAFSVLGDDSNQYLMHCDLDDFEWVTLSQRRKELFTIHFREFLLTHQPDVVHIQHTLYLGIDLLREVRSTLPNTPIVHTLHEFRPICHRDGVLVRTKGDELCLEASPRRCNECFPDLSQELFFMRERFIRSHLSLVDLFLAPSQFLMDRYIDWGIAPERIRFSDYGRAPVRSIPAGPGEVRNKLGYFGQLNPYKGVNVLLEAMRLLGENGHHGTNGDGGDGEEQPSEFEPRLLLHGANLEKQSDEFQTQFNELVEATTSNVTYVGKYDKSSMVDVFGAIDWVVVPSVWWENSPLVIQEAFLCGRPVICSNIGGMAEKVADGINGLHFQTGDPVSLAETIRKAVSSPTLWEQLRRGMPPIKTAEEDVRFLIDTYVELIEARADH
jgi:glycosyltransferase involved in cell wall biosynthesis